MIESEKGQRLYRVVDVLRSSTGTGGRRWRPMTTGVHGDRVQIVAGGKLFHAREFPPDTLLTVQWSMLLPETDGEPPDEGSS